MQHQSTITTLCLIKLSTVGILPKAVVQEKNTTLCGALVHQIAFQEKNNWRHPLAPHKKYKLQIEVFYQVLNTSYPPLSPPEQHKEPKKSY